MGAAAHGNPTDRRNRVRGRNHVARARPGRAWRLLVAASMSEAEQQTERAEAPSEVQNNPPPLPARRKREREVSGPVQEEAAEAAPAPATTTKKVRGDESQPSFSSFASSASPFAGVKGNEEKKEEKEEEVKEKKSDEAKAGSKKDEKATDVANAAGADVPAVSMPTSTPAAAPAVMPATETLGASVSSAPTTPVSAPIATPITAPVSGATAAPIAAPVTGGPQLGFGAFAARSAPFKSATALSEKAVEAEKDTSNWTKAEKEEALQPDAQDIVVRKRSLRRPDTELTTGEEEEKTIYSARAKLFTMAKDQSWKERGTGAMKINLRTHENGTSARLGTYLCLTQ